MRITQPKISGRPASRYERKREHRGRGLVDLERRVGRVCAEIDSRLARQDVVRVLELGCGFGIALLDLVERYRDRIIAFGITRVHADTGRALQRHEARQRGLEDAVTLPFVTVADVSRGIPFANDAIDLVVSQVAWQYFANKAGVLREVVRVLRSDGAGMIDADEFDSRLPAEYARLVEIWDNGRLVPFGEYVTRHGGILVQTLHGQALRITKTQGLAHDLESRIEIDCATINPGWDGVKCVYTVSEKEEGGRSRP